MAASHDNFKISTLIDHFTGVAGNVIDFIRGGITSRAEDTTANPNTNNLGNPKIVASTHAAGATFVDIDNATIALGTPTVPFIFTVKDELGTAGTLPITIVPESGNLDGTTDTVINTNFGSVTLYVDGTDTWILSTN